MNTEPSKPLTVGDLRKALQDVPDETEIVVRASGEDEDLACPLMGAELETSHDEDETVFLALDAYELEP
jgi:hypothetical protein